MVGPATLIAGLMKVKDSYNCDRLGIVAARAALEDQPWMRRNVEKIKVERAKLTRALRDLGFTALDSQSNFVLARPPKGTAQDLYLKLKERHILIRYFHRPRVNEFVRITIGSPQEIQALLAAIAELLR
jgi:histidinol-phosphate aminotransferase